MGPKWALEKDGKMVGTSKSILTSLDWFKGKFTGNLHI
jgi:hypothetical protein